MTEQSEPTATDNSFTKRIASDSDPQLFEGGEEIEIIFHSQDEDRLPPAMPRKFKAEPHPANHEFIQYTEQGDDLMHPIILIHRKDKAISPENFFEPDAIKAKYKVKLIAVGAGVLAAGGLALLAIKKRKN